MNRRDFIRHLALLSAGIAALPEAVLTYEQSYTLNAPAVETGLVYIKEVMLGGVASTSTPAMISLYTGDVMYGRLGMNLFGGVIRWVMTPDMPILSTVDLFRWEVTDGWGNWVDPSTMRGSIRYIDQQGRYRSANLLPCGSLALSDDSPLGWQLAN